MDRAVVALGSNLGDRRATLIGAVERLNRLGTVVAVSGLYETAPVGGPDQDDYLNAVAMLDTELSAEELLGRLHEIESEFDRTRHVHWGPRTLDLDLILLGENVISSPTLQLPHPRYRHRRFVMEPLLEVWPGAVDPDGSRLADELATLSGQQLARVADPSWAQSRTAPMNRAWVLGQLGMVGVFVVAVVVPERALQHWAYSLLGAALLVVGGAVVVLAGRDLGRMLTPFPEPVSGGAIVQTGVYRHVRHPMYAGGLCAGLGVALVVGTIAALVVWVAGLVFFTFKARHEERLLRHEYPGYAAYESVVRRRFLPG